MAGEAGFAYEVKLYEKLKKANLVPSGFGRPAGSDSNLPDGMFHRKGKDYKFEIKLDLKADFGQGSLEYDVAKKKWILGGAQTDSGMAMRKFLESMRVAEIVNTHWGPKGPPMKAVVPLKDFKQKHVDHDYKHFTDTHVSIKSEAVENYYGVKHTHYIQIGKFGMYYMLRDIAGLKIPRFSPQLSLRIRLKRGGSHPIYNYRFSTAIQVKGTIAKSPVDLDEDVQFLRM